MVKMVHISSGSKTKRRLIAAPLLLWTLLLYSVPARAQLLFNELVVHNFRSLEDFSGNYPTWIELYNAGDHSINTSGYTLVEEASSPPLTWSLPAYNIPPKSYLILAFSGKFNLSAPVFHVPFELPSTFYLSLYATQNQVSDRLYWAQNPVADISYGRQPNGSSNWTLLSDPTPLASNNNSPVYYPDTSQILIYPQPGTYIQEQISVQIQSSNPNAMLFYTLDGTEPTPFSNLYQNSLELSAQNSVKPRLAYIRTGGITLEAGAPWEWNAPQVDPQSACLIRARAFNPNGTPISKEVNALYFIGKNAPKHSLPTFSFVANEEDLFSNHKGIFVQGNHRGNNNQPELFEQGGNYLMRGRDWERTASAHLFDPNGSLLWNMNVGIRTHGGSSRNHPQKSIRVYARNLYQNNRLDFPFFENRNFSQYKHVILRNAGQDNIASMMADALSCSLYEGLNFEFQQHWPVVHYINGEYWGIANLRDRISDYFIAMLHPSVNRNQVRITAFWKEEPDGTSPQHRQVRNYLQNHHPNTPECYEYVKQRFDLNSYIDYHLAKIIIGAYDWPGNNMEAWWEDKPNAKLRWIMFDTDEAFSMNPAYNTLKHATDTDGPEWPNPDWSTFILRSLLQNDSIASQFVKRAQTLIQSHFATQKIIRHIDSFENMYQNEMPAHIDRWQLIENMNAWREQLNYFRYYALNRPCHLKEHFIEFFNLNPEHFLPNISCNPLENKEQSNSLELMGNPGNEELTVKISCSEADRITLRIVNNVGQIIHELTPTPIHPGTNLIPINNIQSPHYGVMYVHATGSNFNAGQKWLRIQGF